MEFQKKHRMIITISGKQGAGKTSIGKKIAKSLGYDFLSIGDLRGFIAIDYGLTIDELNDIGKTQDWVHKKADEKTIEIEKTRDNFVLEGWAGYHFIPHSFKIFMDVDEDIGTERIFKDQRPDERPCKTKEKMKELLKKRLNQTSEQFKKYYEINFLDKSQYDLVIDSSNKTKQEIIKLILKKIKNEEIKRDSK